MIFDIKLKVQIGFLINTILVITALAACSTYPDKNIDPVKNNKAIFEKDAIECARSYPEAASGVHVHQRISCMKLKGWY